MVIALPPPRAVTGPLPAPRPGLTTLWRAPGESQVGADPRLALVLTGLTSAEQRLLEALTSPIPRRGGVRQLARHHRVAPERAEQLVEHLLKHGVLIATEAEDSGTLPARAGRDERSGLLDLWRPAARGAGRGDASVAVVPGEGAAALALSITSLLAQAGVGAVELVDGAPVSQADVSPGGFLPTDVGQDRRSAALAHLRRTSPRIAACGERPDVVVLVEPHVSVPFRSSGLLREDITHLSVVVREIDVVLGPVVRPGRDACLRCLDLTRLDRDPAWAALATQLAVAPAPRIPAALVQLAAGAACLEVLELLDGREPTLASATAELGALAFPGRRRWAPHPRCGCGAHQVR